MRLEESLKEQIKKLAVIQYLIWQTELPEGFNREAIELSFCYHLLGLPFDQKINSFQLSVMRVMVGHLAKKFDLPVETASLKVLEKQFRLEIDGERKPVSDGAAVNQALAQAGSKLRLCSGYYGPHKFFILGEATEKQCGGFTVYRLKREAAISPGCHLLMAAMVGGKDVFLRESSARFLFFHKWRKALNSGRSDTESAIKRSALENFGIRSEADFKGRSKKLVKSFTDNLFYHELNHNSIGAYADEETVGIAQASAILGKNILNHFIEIFADWLPGEGTESPLHEICKAQDMAALLLYISDNWFYDSSFNDEQIFSTLDLAPLFRHVKGDNLDWQGLQKEIQDRKNGSLINLYRRHFEEVSQGLKKIAEGSEYTITDRPINYLTLSGYVENNIKTKNQNVKGMDYAITYWSNVFSYLNKFSPDGRRAALQYLAEAEKRLVQEIEASIEEEDVKISIINSVNTLCGKKASAA